MLLHITYNTSVYVLGKINIRQNLDKVLDLQNNNKKLSEHLYGCYSFHKLMLMSVTSLATLFEP